MAVARDRRARARARAPGLRSHCYWCGSGTHSVPREAGGAAHHSHSHQLTVSKSRHRHRSVSRHARYERYEPTRTHHCQSSCNTSKRLQEPLWLLSVCELKRSDALQCLLLPRRHCRWRCYCVLWCVLGIKVLADRLVDTERACGDGLLSTRTKTLERRCERVLSTVLHECVGCERCGVALVLRSRSLSTSNNKGTRSSRSSQQYRELSVRHARSSSSSSLTHMRKSAQSRCSSTPDSHHIPAHS